MTKERVCANSPVMSRRTLLAAAPTFGLVGLATPVLARPAPTFEERATEIADMMRQHFRTNLPEGCQRYSVQIYDAWDRPRHPNEAPIVGYASGGLHWMPFGGGWT